MIRTEFTQANIEAVEEWLNAGRLPRKKANEHLELVDENLVFGQVARVLGYMDYLESRIRELEKE